MQEDVHTMRVIIERMQVLPFCVASCACSLQQLRPAQPVRWACGSVLHMSSRQRRASSHLVRPLAGGSGCQNGLDSDGYQAASVAATPEVSKQGWPVLGDRLEGHLEHRMVERKPAAMAGHESQGSPVVLILASMFELAV